MMGTTLIKDIEKFLHKISRLALDYSYNSNLEEKRILELHLTEELHCKIDKWFKEECIYTSGTLLKRDLKEKVSTYTYINGIKFNIITSKDINKIYISNYEHWKESIQIKPTWKFHIENIEDIPFLIIINKIEL